MKHYKLNILWIVLFWAIQTVVAQTAEERRAAMRDSLRDLRRQRIEALNQAAPGNNAAGIPAPATVNTTPANRQVPAINNAGSRNGTEINSTSQPETIVEAEKDSLPISDTVMIEELSVRNTEIRDLMQGLAVQYGLNLYMAREVTGAVSVNFSNIPLRQAMKILIEENGYSWSVENSLIKVFKPVQKAPAPPKEKPLKISGDQDALSIDVQNETLNKVVRRIVELTSRTVVLDQSVSSERVTLFVKDVPFETALNLISEGNGLSLRERDGIYTFYRQEWMKPSAMGQPSSSPGKIWVKIDDKQLVSLEVNDAPISAVLSQISSQAGINTVIYGSLKGSVTAKIQKVPITEALKYLFRGSEFTFWENRGIFFIGPHSMQTANNSTLIRLKHMKGEEALTLLPASLTKSTQIKVVKSQNALMAVGSYDDIDAVSQYIEKMDMPIAQILLEVLVVDVDLEKARTYGVDMFLGDVPSPGSAEPLYPSFEQTLNRTQSQDVLDKVGMGDVVSLPKDFFMKVKALEQEKMLDVKSRSQIATLNGETAVLTIGQTQYFLLTSETDYNQGDAVTNRTTERFEKVEANVTLTVTPYVTGKNEVTCEIVPDFSEPEGSFDSNVPPTLNRRYVKSSVRLRNGETIILGGMVKETQSDVHRQVPFLGSIPIIGWLFKNVDRVSSRSQLLIFITPTIYYGKEGSVDPDKVIGDFER